MKICPIPATRIREIERAILRHDSLERFSSLELWAVALFTMSPDIRDAALRELRRLAARLPATHDGPKRLGRQNAHGRAAKIIAKLSTQ